MISPRYTLVHGERETQSLPRPRRDTRQPHGAPCLPRYRAGASRTLMAMTSTLFDQPSGHTDNRPVRRIPARWFMRINEQMGAGMQNGHTSSVGSKQDLK